jgi:flavin prenyltransferase
MKKIIVAIGGSSGSIYAKRLLDKLTLMDQIEGGIVLTANAKVNWEIELGKMSDCHFPYKIYDNKDFFAPFASGSAKYETMVIIPCSMSLLGRIANGVSDDLIGRAADVMLKERRKLIVVPRETPYNLIHLRNMTMLTESGAIICPATPSFYSKPDTIDAVVDTVVDRVIDLMGLDIQSYRWSEE